MRPAHLNLLLFYLFKEIVFVLLFIHFLNMFFCPRFTALCHLWLKTTSINQLCNSGRHPSKMTQPGVSSDLNRQQLLSKLPPKSPEISHYLLCLGTWPSLYNVSEMMGDKSVYVVRCGWSSYTAEVFHLLARVLVVAITTSSGTVRGRSRWKTKKPSSPRE